MPILEPRKHSILRIALRGVHVDSSFAARDVPLNRKVRQWPHRETNAVRKRCAYYVGVVQAYGRGEWCAVEESVGMNREESGGQDRHAGVSFSSINMIPE